MKDWQRKCSQGSLCVCNGEAHSSFAAIKFALCLIVGTMLHCVGSDVRSLWSDQVQVETTLVLRSNDCQGAVTETRFTLIFVLIQL